jgi:hypothetical protein
MNYQGPGRYRHYKGGEYQVLGLAIHEDADGAVQNPDQWYVVYAPLTPGGQLDRTEVDYWLRKLSVFNEWVKGAYPRFRYLGDD